MEGLFKVDFWTVNGSGRGVLYARDGVMLGGNSAFAFVGRYAETRHGIECEITTRRHHDDPRYQPLFGIEEITLTLKGQRSDGATYSFEGGTPTHPGAQFTSVLTPIDDSAAPPPGVVAADGIANGLYSIHIRMLDGIDGGNTGVMVLQDGAIRGGDAFFDYIGAYSSGKGRWKGEIVNHEHSSAHGERPIFGGYEVGIGFTGTYDANGAEAEATALAGKRSIRFAAAMKLLHPT